MSAPDTKKYVLLEDDFLMQITWEESARKNQIDLTIFKTSDEFITAIDTFSKDTIFYLDVELGEGPTGDQLAQKLFDKGLENIFLSTGHPADDFKHLTFIKGVIKKRPPWEA